MAINRLIVDIEMVDGTVHKDVGTTLADQMLFSKTRKVQKWDGPTEDPLLFLNFMAYAALRRNGLFEGGFDAFTNQCAAVGQSGDEPVDPTQSAALDDSTPK